MVTEGAPHDGGDADRHIVVVEGRLHGDVELLGRDAQVAQGHDGGAAKRELLVLGAREL